MKIGKFDNDRSTKLVATIPESVFQDLVLYAECHKSIHGQEPQQSRLVAEMLRTFMHEDASFQRWLKAHRAGASAPAAGAAAAKQPQTPKADPLPQVEPTATGNLQSSPSFQS